MQQVALVLLAWFVSSMALVAIVQSPPRFNLPRFIYLRRAWELVNVPFIETVWMGWLLGAVVAACLAMGWWQSN